MRNLEIPPQLHLILCSGSSWCLKFSKKQQRLVWGQPFWQVPPANDVPGHLCQVFEQGSVWFFPYKIIVVKVIKLQSFPSCKAIHVSRCPTEINLRGKTIHIRWWFQQWNFLYHSTNKAKNISPYIHPTSLTGQANIHRYHERTLQIIPPTSFNELTWQASGWKILHLITASSLSSKIKCNLLYLSFVNFMVHVKQSNPYQISTYNVCSCGVLRRRRGLFFKQKTYSKNEMPE